VKVFHKDRLRVLLIGLDYDYDRLDQRRRSHRERHIMALSLDFKNHSYQQLSVPRDMVATLPNGSKRKSTRRNPKAGSRSRRA